MNRRRSIWAACIAALALACRPAAAAPAVSLENAVKATFLYKFAEFIEWPAVAFETASSPFNICVLGNDPIAELMDRVAAGQQAGNHAIAVRHLQMLTRDSGCHILYVAESVPLPAEAIGAVRGTPVLTITDSARIVGTQGIISFVIQDNHVRFDIDSIAAAESGLMVSSKLLSLARMVRAKS